MPPAVTKKKAATGCPLFPDAEPELMPEDIREIRIFKYYHDKRGREVRRMLARNEHLFALDPFTHTDQDFIDAYEESPGKYYLEAVNHGGKPLDGGHIVMVGRGEDDDEDDEQDVQEPMVMPMQPSVMAAPAPREDGRMFEMMQKMFDDRERNAQAQLEAERNHASRETKLYTEFVGAMMGSKRDPDELVRELRSQLEDLRRKSARDEEETRRTYREDLSRRDKEIDDLRRRASNEEDDLRKRWRDDVADLRSKYERHLSEEMSRRQQLEKQVYDLQKENLELQKELARANDEPPPPQGPPGLPPGAPPWMQVMATPVGGKLMEAGNKLIDRVTGALEPARPPPPPQQYAPQPPQFAPPPYEAPQAPPNGGMQMRYEPPAPTPPSMPPPPPPAPPAVPAFAFGNPSTTMAQPPAPPSSSEDEEEPEEDEDDLEEEMDGHEPGSVLVRDR